MLWDKITSGIFEVYNISPVAIFNAMPIAYSLLLELDRISKNADTLLMIYPLCLTLCSYFANALGFDTLLIQWNDTWSFSWLFAIFFYGIEETGNLYFFRNLHLLSFPTMYSLPCFALKWCEYEYFPRGHPCLPRMPPYWHELEGQKNKQKQNKNKNKKKQKGKKERKKLTPFRKALHCVAHYRKYPAVQRSYDIIGQFYSSSYGVS